MVVTKSASGKVIWTGIPGKVLRNMTGTQLEWELKRVDRDLVLHHRAVAGSTHGVKQLLAAERRVLICERKRIQAEINGRLAASEFALDHSEIMDNFNEPQFVGA